jgi:hypothetical protein
MLLLLLLHLLRRGKRAGIRPRGTAVASQRCCCCCCSCAHDAIVSAADGAQSCAVPVSSATHCAATPILLLLLLLLASPVHFVPPSPSLSPSLSPSVSSPHARGFLSPLLRTQCLSDSLEGEPALLRQAGGTHRLLMLLLMLQRWRRRKRGGGAARRGVNLACSIRLCEDGKRKPIPVQRRVRLLRHGPIAGASTVQL